MPGRFAARCQRGHELVEFTDPTEFERHMTGTHKARRIRGGMPDTPRRGGLPNKYLRPSRAPRTTEGLTRVLKDRDHWGAKDTDGGRGLFAGVAEDWSTDERVPPTALRAGDVFEFGRRAYTVVEVHPDTWTLSADENGSTRTGRLGEQSAAKLREAERVTIIKRAA